MMGSAGLFHVRYSREEFVRACVFMGSHALQHVGESAFDSRVSLRRNKYCTEIEGKKVKKAQYFFIKQVKPGV